MSVLDYVPRRVCDELVEVLVRLDELGESVERRSPAGLVVCCRDAGRQPLVYTDHVGAAVCIAEGDRDRHLAAQRGICRFKLVYLDEELVRHELDETAVI